MDRPRISLLLIGQTPRPDLTDPLRPLAAACELSVRGALDGLAADDLPTGQEDAAYPLVTRLRSGAAVTVGEAFLTPHLQRIIDAQDDAGAIAHLLLCAGPFAALTSRRPLLRPFGLGAAVLRTMGCTRPAVLVPTHGQRRPAHDKWAAAGLTPTAVWSMADRPTAQPAAEWVGAQAMAHGGYDAVVFDYVGYAADVVQQVQARLAVPVLDLGHLAVAALGALLPGCHAESNALNRMP